MTDSRAAIRPFVTNLDQPVFALRNLPEEVVAVLFAYYSRSADSLRDNLARLLAEGDLSAPEVMAPDDKAELAMAREKARQFHEKWVVGYGHASVAEHAVVHLAVEDISIVATKVLEDNRLASYTEKSTRYVRFDEDSFLREPTIMAGPHAALYEATCKHLLRLYTDLLGPVGEAVSRQFPQPEGWTEARYRSVCRAKAFDLLRYLLPASLRTNVGLTANARTLEHLLTKLYSHPLAELRELATALHREAEQIVPTLIKYAAPNDYLRRGRERLGELAANLPPGAPEPSAPGARLVRGPAEPLLELATALLYEATHLSCTAVRARVAALTDEERLAVITAALADRGRFDPPPRALEQLSYTFEVTLDYGAYRDIQRHRMCTQAAQVLSTNLGYDLPAELDELGHGDACRAALEASGEAHRVIAGEHGEEVAQYVLPLAWRKRLLVTLNLRELFHFIGLRSGRQGHASYRRVAQECWREIHRQTPELADLIRVDLETYDLARA